MAHSSRTQLQCVATLKEFILLEDNLTKYRVCQAKPLITSNQLIIVPI